MRHVNTCAVLKGSLTGLPAKTSCSQACGSIAKLVYAHVWPPYQSKMAYQASSSGSACQQRVTATGQAAEGALAGCLHQAVQLWLRMGGYAHTERVVGEQDSDVKVCIIDPTAMLLYELSAGSDLHT